MHDPTALVGGLAMPWRWRRWVVPFVIVFIVQQVVAAERTSTGVARYLNGSSVVRSLPDPATVLLMTEESIYKLTALCFVDENVTLVHGAPYPGLAWLAGDGPGTPGWEEGLLLGLGWHSHRASCVLGCPVRYRRRRSGNAPSGARPTGGTSLRWFGRLLAVE